MTDAPLIRASAAAEERIAELTRDLESERATRIALDAEIVRLKAQLAHQRKATEHLLDAIEAMIGSSAGASRAEGKGTTP